MKKTGPTSIVPTGTNYFVYNEQGQLIGEYNSSGAVIQEYVWLGTMPIAVLRGTTGSPTVFYVYADQIDRPWVITNTANQIRWRWDTSPFGELAANENPSGLGTFAFNQRLAGQYRDAETGLFYNYFRDYDPQTGRYVQSDPIGLGAGTNPYSYVRQDPVRATDRLGLVGDNIGKAPRPPVPGFVDPSLRANRGIARELQRWLDSLMAGDQDDGPAPPTARDPIQFPDDVPYIPPDLCHPDCRKTQITMQIRRRGIIADGMKSAEVTQFNHDVAIHNRICGLVFYVPPLLVAQ